MERPNAWKSYSKKELKELEKLNKGYMDFLSYGKTERMNCKQSVDALRKAGYEDLEDLKKANKQLKAGDKVYAVNMGKSLVAWQIGTEPMEAGMNILGAHIDSPRMDIKQNPLYEDHDMAYLDTHYYGGIKKWQWVTLPLAIHGVVVK